MISNLSLQPVHRLLSLVVLAILSLTGLGFTIQPAGIDMSSGACALPTGKRQFSLDGVNLTICLPFSPDVFTSATEKDMVQSAYAFNKGSGQEFSIYAIPYGLQPAADNLPVSKPNIANLYQELSFKVYEGENLADFEAQPVALFGRTITGRSVMVANRINNIASNKKLITQWVVEAGGRVWMARLTQDADLSQKNNPTSLPGLISLTATNLYQSSTSLRISREPAPAVINTNLTSSATDLPFPSWWKGDCDVNGFPGSYPLGASYRGVKTCGPLNSMHIVRFKDGLVGQYEWQCVEYVKRYIYLAYGIAPYLANGNGVVKNYPGTLLEKVLNGTPNKGPSAGDVISYNGPSTYGHTSLVTASTIDANGNGTVTIAEQNYSRSGTRTHTVSNWYINSSDGVYGWLHDNQLSENPPPGFAKCSAQGGLCSFTGTAEVSYGARSSFTAPRIFKDNVDCNNAVFGDPIAGVAKGCYYKPATSDNLTSWATTYFSGLAYWLDNSDVTGKMCDETISSYGLDKDYLTAAPCGNETQDDWVAEYNATVTFAPGNYVFQAQNDDGLKAWVDGQSVFDRSESASLSASCPAKYISGSVPVRIMLRDEADKARIRFLWSTDTNICTLPSSFAKKGPVNGATGQPLSKIISWTASQNVISYLYCVDSTDNATCDTTWQKAGAQTTSKTISGLSYNSTYYWQVKAINEGGEVLANDDIWWSFTTMPDPTTCYALTLSHTGNGTDPVASPMNAEGCPSQQYRTGDVVSLTAVPESEYRVKNWFGTNDNASKSVTNTLTMPAYAHVASVVYELAGLDIPVTISPTGQVPNDYHPIYKWYASPKATSYLLTVYNEDTSQYVINARAVSAVNCKGTPAVCSFHPNVSLGNYHYIFKVAAKNATGNSEFSPSLSFYIGKMVAVFTSKPGQDGHILESAENSNNGYGFNSTSVALVIGDDFKNREYRAFLSFDTSSLPDNAVILSSTISLMKKDVLGIDPFSTHGLLIMDIRKQNFGTSPKLQRLDFAAAAEMDKAGIVRATTANGVYTGQLIANAFQYVNKLGFTQLRLRFEMDDDNDAITDELRFYSGNISTAAFRPVLKIYYYVP